MNTLYKKATYSDLIKPASGLNLSQAQILQLPKGALFTDKKGVWQVKTTKPLKKIQKDLKNKKSYKKSKQEAIDIFGEDNVFSIRCVGHRVSEMGTRKKYGFIPVLPQIMGSYFSYAFGHREEFSQSTVELGDQFDHDGTQFLCIYMHKSRGCPESLAITSVIALRIK